MKCLIVSALLLLPGAAFAQTPFDGTWKTELETAQFSDKAERLELKDGRFRAPTWVPPVDVQADGTDQRVNAAYFDTIAVQVVDERTVRLRYAKDGKAVSEWTSTVTADGQEVLDVFTYYPPDGAPVKGSGRRERVKPREADGGHQLTGWWRIKKLEQISDSVLTWTFKSTPGGMTMRNVTGEWYDAKYDGKEYPIHEDRAGTSVSIERLDDRTLQETYWRKGAIVGHAKYVVSVDDQTIEVTYEDKEQGTRESWVGRKQP